jgi:hypothetical protein
MEGGACQGRGAACCNRLLKEGREGEGGGEGREGGREGGSEGEKEGRKEGGREGGREGREGGSDDTVSVEAARSRWQSCMERPLPYE